MISVILVNWNSWGDTLSCVQSLLNSETVPFRIIVVDNASSDESLGAFERWAKGNLEIKSGDAEIMCWSNEGASKHRSARFLRYVETESRFAEIAESNHIDHGTGPEIHFVSSGRNGGFGFGCNVGMRLANTLGTDSYWLLNNDCLVAPETLRQMSAAVEAHPEVIFGSLVRDFITPHAIQAAGGGRLSRRTGKNALVAEWPLHRSIDYVYGASMAFSARCRAVVGEFDENIFMYYEEIDLCLRAAKAGIRCDVVDANVYHKQGGSQNGASSNAWTHVMLNKRYVLHKHFGWGSWTAVYWFSLLLRCVLPLGGVHATIGSRRALLAIVAKGGC